MGRRKVIAWAGLLLAGMALAGCNCCRKGCCNNGGSCQAPTPLPPAAQPQVQTAPTTGTLTQQGWNTSRPASSRISSPAMPDGKLGMPATAEALPASRPMNPFGSSGASVSPGNNASNVIPASAGLGATFTNPTVAATPPAPLTPPAQATPPAMESSITRSTVQPQIPTVEQASFNPPPQAFSTSTTSTAATEKVTAPSAPAPEPVQVRENRFQDFSSPPDVPKVPKLEIPN